ncbi:flagellar motor protein MotB [Pseudochelatococcus sp. G4_1912]|uniref:flagellar motor protein MotB n=1 Tax=Pseudochelatococcus sp. G4_1912 TaxID=3114288 RepID=UPI0039C61AFF
MDKIEQELILIQRRNQEPEEHGAHGIWKIAYADFMTALMAFFLIMWLLNVTSKDQRTSVANYFNPIKLADISPTRKGVENPQETPPQDQNEADKAVNPSQPESANTGASEKMTGDAAHAAKPRYPESALFMDPYAILAKLAGDEKPTTTATGSNGSEATAKSAPRVDAVRDPFDPAYWRLAPEGQPSAISQDGQPKAGTAGGTVLLESDTSPAPASPVLDKTMDAAQQELAREVSTIKEDVSNALKEESRTPGAPVVDVKATDEGILISLTDAEAFSMFAVGSAEPNPAVVRAIARIATTLADKPGTIILRGHTDSLPFKSDTYDNWRLSSARAHMASYMLIRGGLDQSRIERIEGYADRMPLNEKNTRAPENRRIEILLREKRA